MQKNNPGPYCINFDGWLLEQLWRAYLTAQKGKRKTKDEHYFELNEMENLINLRDDVILRKATQNFTQPAFIVKADLTSYFMSLDREDLIERINWGLDRQFGGE